MQLNGFKYCKWLSSSICCIDRILTGTTPPGPSRFESNGNEEVLYILQIPKLEPHHQM